MRSKSALDNMDPGYQGLQTAASRALAIPELLELVLGDKAVVSDNLQFRLVDRLWNATCRATILQSLNVREYAFLADDYDGVYRIAEVMLYKEPKQACLVKELDVDIAYHPLDRAGQPSPRGAGWQLFTKILPHMVRLQDLTLFDSSSRWFFSMAPRMEDLRNLYLDFGPAEYTDAMDNDIRCSLAQCRNLQTLRVIYDLGHFDRTGRLQACSDFFKIAGKQLLKLSLIIVGLEVESLRKVLTAIGTQCPHINDLNLRLLDCESGKLDTFRPLLTDKLQRVDIGFDCASCLTEFLENLVDPSFLPNLRTAPALPEFRYNSLSIPLAAANKALRALEQRGTIANLARMRAMIYDCYGKQIEGQ